MQEEKPQPQEAEAPEPQETVSPGLIDLLLPNNTTADVSAGRPPAACGSTGTLRDKLNFSGW